MPGSSRPGCSAARTAARPGATSTACATIPRGPTGRPGGGGLILHSIVPHPSDPEQLWVAISAAGVFHTADGGADLGAAQPRHPQRLHARGALSRVRPVRALPGHGAWHARSALPAEPLRHVPQRRRRPRSGRASRRACPRPSAFRPPPIRAIRIRSTCCRSMATPPAATCPTAAPRSGGPATAGASWQALRQGLPQENVFFGVLRQAMATDRLAPAGVYFGTNTGSALCQRRRGRQLDAASASTCRRFFRSKRWWWIRSLAEGRTWSRAGRRWS